MHFPDGNKSCSKCGVLISADGIIRIAGNYDDDMVGTEVLTPESTTPEPSVTIKEPVHKESSSSPSRYTMETVASLSSGESDRGISAQMMKRYGVKFGFSPEDRSIDTHFYPITRESKVTGYKMRVCPTKTFMTIGDVKGAELFGMLAFSKKKGNDVVICEGELDAMSAQMMLEKHSHNIMCLSVPFGASVTKAISDNIEFLKDQATVTLAYDQDEAGEKAVDETFKLLPNIRVMKFTENDPNAMLTGMATTEFRNSYDHAGNYRPKVLASVENMVDSEVVAPVKMGLSYPWQCLTDMTYGLHKNQVIGIGAAPGVGKTTLVRGIQQHLMFHHKEKIGIFSLEEKAEWTTRQLIGYIMNKPIHIPGTKYNVAQAEAVKKQLEGLAYFYEHQYYTGQWQEIEQMIRYLHSIGVNYFFIDPLSSLVSHLTPSEANHFLSEAMYALSKLVQTIDITVFHVNHLNTASDGKSHEAGARVYASQFTGSRAQWRYSHGLIGAERNVLADDGTANELTLRYLKDRAFGNTGHSCSLVYNKMTGRLDDPKMLAKVKF